MITTVILAFLLCSIYCTGQNQVATNFSIGDDQANWADLWKAISTSKSADSRSGVGDSTRPALFDIILRVNAQARSKSRQRGSETEFLFQGDIAMNKRDVVALFRNGERRKRAVMKKLATKLWQQNNIAYVISSDFGAFAKQRIIAAIKQWQNTLPCMGEWKDISKLESTKRPRDYIRFIKGEGCYSRVGRQGGRQVISVGTGCEHTGVVVHEIGHAMGFWHEQSRTDRDNYVVIHWNNILPAMRFNFEKYSSSKINDLGVSYDYDSVMHYGSKAFSKDGRALTISIKQGKTKNVRARLGQKYQLSDKDKKQAQLLYNCITKTLPCSSSPCLNGGVCRNNGDKYNCRCITRYTGVRCEKKIIKSPCSSYPCLNGGICRNNGDKYNCRCTSSYTGMRCEKRATDHVCVDKDRRCGGWGRVGYCNPEKGYKDFMKKTCCATCNFHTTVKPSPCNSSPCLNSGACTNDGDKYSCSCTSGYTGTRCETKVRPCSSSPCLNGGVCTNNKDRYRCRCSSGYRGTRCEVKGTRTRCTENKQTKNNCERWKRYCVFGSTYYEYMKKNCCKTCEENCKDKHAFCATWSKNNFCRLKDFKPFMQRNCVVSCGFSC